MKIPSTLARRTAGVALMVALGSLAAVDAAVAAVPIAGLYNTGTGPGSVNGAIDPNYALSKAGGGTGTNGFDSGGTVGFPFGPWLSNGPNSDWLTPTATAGQSFDPGSNGIYTWTLSFSLTGFDPNTASFSGQWSSDNNSKVLFNGAQIAIQNNSEPFRSWTPFSASSGFNPGSNTLQFVVTNLGQNGGNPTGLRVEFLQSSVTPVPEPESYAMMLAGLGLVGFVARRRMQ